MRWLVLIALLVPAAALAHGEAEWIRGHPDYGWCCGVNDCGPLRVYGATMEEVAPGEYLVTMPPDSHPLLPDGGQKLFREGDGNVFPSQRLEPYVCAYGGEMRCFFPPPRGF